MDTRTIVKLWLEGGNNLSVYLGKIHMPFLSCWYFQTTSVTSVLFCILDGEDYH